MSVISTPAIKTDINTNIFQNSSQLITGSILNSVLINVADSYLNRVTGGLLMQAETGYTTLITLTDQKAFAHKGYVDSAVNGLLPSGTTSQYYRGDKSLSDFQTDVRGTLLTGLPSFTNTVISATDSVFGAFSNLQGQISAIDVSGFVPYTGALLNIDLNGKNISNIQSVGNELSGSGFSASSFGFKIGLGFSYPSAYLRTAGLLLRNNKEGSETATLNYGLTSIEYTNTITPTNSATYNLPIGAKTGIQTFAMLSDLTGSGITSLNGLAVASQTFAVGTTGTDFNISSAGSVHTFNLPSSSATNRGLLTPSKYIEFDTKESGTGVYEGGIATIGTPTNTFSLTAGTGKIKNTSTFAETPVSWLVVTNQAVTNIAGFNSTYIRVNSLGAIEQTNTSPTKQDFMDYVYLAILVHPNRTSVTSTISYCNPLLFLNSSVRDLYLGIGDLNLSGNVFSANGANLKINKSTGEALIYGANRFADNVASRNIKTISATTQQVLIAVLRNDTIVSQGTDVDVNNYDLAGVATTIPAGNKWVNHLLITFSDGTTLLQLGQIVYSSYSSAVAGIVADRSTFVVSTTGQQGIKLSWLTVKARISDLQASIIAGESSFSGIDKFGNSTISQGITTMNQAYLNSVQPQISIIDAQGSLQLRSARSNNLLPIFEGQNIAGTTTFSVDGDGDVVGNSFTKSDAGLIIGTTTLNSWDSVVNSIPVIRHVGIASAVNYLQVSNSATLNNIVLSAQGSDPNRTIQLVGSGTGNVVVGQSTTTTGATPYTSSLIINNHRESDTAYWISLRNSFNNTNFAINRGLTGDTLGFIANGGASVSFLVGTTATQWSIANGAANGSYNFVAGNLAGHRFAIQHNTTFSATSGTWGGLLIDGAGAPFSPSTGTANYFGIKSTMTINQVTSANGAVDLLDFQDTFTVLRGAGSAINIRPTLTSVIGSFDAIKCALNDATNVRGLNFSGTIKHFLSGDINLTGTAKIATYAGLSTVSMGVAPIINDFSVTTRTTAYTTQSLFTPSATGLYELVITVEYAVGANLWVTGFQLNYTNAGVATTHLIEPNYFTTQTSKTYVASIRCDSGTAVTFTTTLAGATTHNIDILTKRLR